MRRAPTRFLRCRTVAVRARVKRGRNSHIAAKCRRSLLRDRGLACLPAEAPEHGFVVLVAPHRVGPPGNAVAVAVVRVGAGEDIRLGNGFQQAHADDRRRDAGRQHRLGVHRPVAEARDTVAGLAEADRLAVGQRYRHLLVGDRDLALALDPLDREVLELPAVGRLGNRGPPVLAQGQALGLGLGRDGEPHEHGLGALASGRWAAAAILQVAALAGARIEEGPQPVRRRGRARRRHPDLPEDAVAHSEVALALEGHVGGGMRKRVPIDPLEHCCCPCGPALVGFCL